MFATLIGTMTIQTVIAADTDYKAQAKAEIVDKIHYYSDKYNVSFQKMYDTVDKETDGTFEPSIQSNCKYSYSNKRLGIVKGEREMSYGLAQIHLPHHPDITREQAEDVDFALNFMAKEYSLGHNIWYSMK